MGCMFSSVVAGPLLCVCWLMGLVCGSPGWKAVPPVVAVGLLESEKAPCSSVWPWEARVVLVCWRLGLSPWSQQARVRVPKWPLATPCYYDGMSTPKWCCQGLYPPGESQLPPASPRGSLRSVSGSDLGCFQIALGLRTCEILHVHCKSGVSASYCPPSLLNISPAGFQSQTFWQLIFLMQEQ